MVGFRRPYGSIGSGLILHIWSRASLTASKFVRSCFADSQRDVSIEPMLSKMFLGWYTIKWAARKLLMIDAAWRA